MKDLTKPNFLEKLGLIKPAKLKEDMPVNPEFARHVGSGMMKQVFESGGVKYFMFCDEARIPAKRAMAAKDVYQELHYRTTREHHLAHFEAMDELLNQGKLAKAIVLNDEMRKRFNYITPIGLYYKLGSVLYIDQSENPNDYDQAYNYAKIERWKKDNDIESFFLKTPLIEYLPFGDLSKIDLAVFTHDQAEHDLNQMAVLSRIISKNPETADLNTQLQFAMETLQNWTGYMR